MNQLELYKPENILGKWGLEQEKIHPEYPEKIFEVLEKEGIVPKRQKDNEPFTIWGPASNNAWIETRFASLLDEHFDDPINKPLVYASDATYPYDESEKRLDHNLKNTAFAFLRHEASKTPIPDDSVDVIFDRLGALWHFLNNDEKEEAKKILQFYITKLKQGGSIILDASDTGSDTVTSTARLILENFSDKELEDVGFERKNQKIANFIGSDEHKLLILKK